MEAENTGSLFTDEQIRLAAKAAGLQALALANGQPSAGTHRDAGDTAIAPAPRKAAARLDLPHSNGSEALHRSDPAGTSRQGPAQHQPPPNQPASAPPRDSASARSSPAPTLAAPQPPHAVARPPLQPSVLDAAAFYGAPREPPHIRPPAEAVEGQGAGPSGSHPASTRHAPGPSPQAGATPLPKDNHSPSPLPNGQTWASGEGSEHEPDSDFELEEDDGTRFSDEEDAGQRWSSDVASDSELDMHPGRSR